MAQIFQAGSLNSTALSVPNLYVSIAAPATVLQGVPSGRIGIVGTAGWGPVNTPVIVGTPSDYLANFSQKQAKATDAGLAVGIAALQGASDFRVVRVTDGTDVAGVAVVLPGVIQIGTHYTGTSGNGVSITVSNVSPSGFVTVSVTSAAFVNEFFTAYVGVSNPTWAPIFAAVNDPTKGSRIVVIVGGANATFSGGGTYVIAGGTDGGTPSTAQFVGTDGSISGAGTGMYALRGQGCQIGVLHGMLDTNSWASQLAYGLNEGTYMVCCGPAGDTIMNAVVTLGQSGARSPYLKMMFGDWLWWLDDANGLMLVPPQAFAAGVMANLGPQNASLNKQIYGVAGSQKTGQVANGGTLTYSSAELSALVTGGLDVICNPAPGGAYWACRIGHNSSASPATQSDSYTRMTNYLALTFAGGMGTYIGAPINDTLFSDIRSTMLSFLSGLLQEGILGTVGGALPYAVKCDATNNPQARIALGYVQCDVQVRYQGINEKFIVNLQGGSSVTVATTSNS